MSANSKIEWTDATWPIVIGCEKVSPGCANCYAVKDANRLAGNPHPNVGPLYTGLVERQRNGLLNWTGVVRPLPQRLNWPFAQKKPLRIFVPSLGDLFHPSVPFEFIDDVFFTMACADWHTYQVLTKQPARMLGYFQWVATRWTEKGELFLGKDNNTASLGRDAWPLRNVWLGVSVENQKAADERIPLLIQVPAAVRFLSCEPLLGKLDLSEWLWDTGYVWDGGEDVIGEAEPSENINWVICGGESGHNARSMNPDWARSLRDQCQGANVAFFFKQWGEWLGASYDFQGQQGFEPSYPRKVGKKAAGRTLDGRTWDEMPEVEAAV